MTSITWASPRYVQEVATILGPQNRTQGSCVVYLDMNMNVQSTPQAAEAYLDRVHT